uniref:Calmodulin n=1 Tax=Alexandrium catenella TaxID=2925 RepID=A0A7S1Q380_ALECA
MTMRSQVSTRSVCSSLVLLAALLDATAYGTHDEMVLVQMSAEGGKMTDVSLSQAQNYLEDDQEDDFDSVMGHIEPGSNAVSLLAVHGFPGVKGMKEQMQEAASFRMAPPEKGYHKKVVKALPQLQSDCKTKPYATEEDCTMAVNLLTMMGKVTEGPEPFWTWHGHLRNMMGIHFWLYTPGTMLCFTILDMDKSKGISYEEMGKLFGAQMVATMSPVWKYMDPDGDSIITREELHKYLRAAILVRSVLPELDGVDPTADTRKCLNMAHRVLAPPAMPMKRMKFYPKLLSIAGIFIGAIALHCLFCAKGSKKGVDQVDAMAEKDPDTKISKN